MWDVEEQKTPQPQVLKGYESKCKVERPESVTSIGAEYVVIGRYRLLPRTQSEKFLLKREGLDKDDFKEEGRGGGRMKEEEEMKEEERRGGQERKKEDEEEEQKEEEQPASVLLGRP